MSSGSYLREHMTRSAPRRRPPGAITSESLMTDRAAYVEYLEGQLEQMTVACLKTESLELRMQQVTSTVSLHDERILALAKLVKIMQSMAEEHASHVRRAVTDCQRRVEGVEGRVSADDLSPALPAPPRDAIDEDLERRIDAKLKAWAEEQMTWARQQALAVELRLQQLVAVQEERTREWVQELVGTAARDAAAETVGEVRAGLRDASGRIDALQGTVAQVQGAVASLSADVRSLAVQIAVQHQRPGASPQPRAEASAARVSAGDGRRRQAAGGSPPGAAGVSGRGEEGSAGAASDDGYASGAGSAAARAAAAAAAATAAAAAAGAAGAGDEEEQDQVAQSAAGASPAADRAAATVLGARLDALTGSLASSQAQTARLQGMVESLQRELASERLSRAAALPAITSLMPQQAGAPAAQLGLASAIEKEKEPASRQLTRRSSLKGASGASRSTSPTRRVSISESRGGAGAGGAQQDAPADGGAAAAAAAALALAGSVTSERAREAQQVVAAAADRRRRLQELYTQLAVTGL